jgi:hypothetical protein
MAIAGAVALKRTRSRDLFDLFIQKEMMRASSTTVIVPAEGPNKRAEVKTKVSETEILAGSEGTLTVNDPVKRVRAAKRNHSTPGGRVDSRQRDSRTIATPIPITVTA